MTKAETVKALSEDMIKLALTRDPEVAITAAALSSAILARAAGMGLEEYSAAHDKTAELVYSK